MKKYNNPEELYMELAILELVKRAQVDNISEYVKNAYKLCEPYLTGVSLQEFAARVSNYNPNKSGIGERSQVIWLKTEKFPGIEKLPSHGKETLCLHVLPNGKHTIAKGKKSNLPGVKSFDAVVDLKDEVALFMFKTVDLGFLTDSTGGGHQNNVHDEIVNFVSYASLQPLSYNGKNVKIYVVIDGRSAGPIISAARQVAGACPHVVIGESTTI